MKKVSIALGLCAILAAPAFANEKPAAKAAPAASEITATTTQAAPANSKKLKKGHKKHAKKKGASAETAPAAN